MRPFLAACHNGIKIFYALRIYSIVRMTCYTFLEAHFYHLYFDTAATLCEHCDPEQLTASLYGTLDAC